MSGATIDEAPLLQASSSRRSERFGKTTLVFLACVGVGFVAGALITSRVNWAAENTEIDMNALPTGIRMGGADTLRPPLGNLGQALRSPTQKCVVADSHAAVCGNIVVLRPTVALRASKESQGLEADKIVDDLKGKFDAIEDKPTAALYAGGAIVALSLANGIVSTVEAVPLVPKLFELIGLTYTGWFTYRYLIFKSSRQELVNDIEELKKKVTEG
jgi:hypothetical protein